ncbi:group II intron reverse transcriptase/maturase [Flammeovirgaceae bacterium SG7u.111]|nr:group II intron reverse transcriptase/maturase [Flammeovirgaceae bacterium SG7u.132]WPO38026.1 group II intron reverse transcriptase/maturase [Flammeovirgaceae bacterium SG7u.111]
MIEKVLQARNLAKACRKVISNKGSAGIDFMDTDGLKSFVDGNRSVIALDILNRKYVPTAIKGVEIPKSNGKTRLLGVPTVVDRWLQQAVSQQLAAKFELEFEGESYGFRPQKNTQKAVRQSLRHINDGYQDIVDIDLKGFFDEVQHYKLLQLIYEKVKCPTTLWLIRKWLRAPIQINGKLHKRRKGVPQDSPLSPLLSNIMLDQLDKYLKNEGCRFVRYADDFSIYTKSKAAAKKTGNKVFLYLKDKLDLPVNLEKSGIRRPVGFEVLGHGFTPTYKKGEKGKYQLVVKEGSWKSLKRKLKFITKKTLPYSLEERNRRLNEVSRGWINNFRLGSIYTKLKKLDEWLRNRLRYCIWHDWKKLERKRKNLIRLGVEQGMAYAWSRTRMGGWAVAQSPILRTTITEVRLKKRGYMSMTDYYQKVKV